MDKNSLLVPVDGSTHSMKAVEYAIDLARILKKRIILLYCHKPFPALLGEPYYQKVVNKILEYSEEMMQPYCDKLEQNGIDFITRILEGNPGERISEVAQHEDCEMIIMGSRGLSELKGLILGSVTHRVLHSAHCPVLVLKN